ncbi:MAG TPA: GNAT family N-acetyltransferase [Caulobacteraceae bacterium]|jgi:ribosomal protein S18 acetylase RimI-like enzyme|nr:GNAT family N-acetyltransferase [Caulobacteraceae bacterium]
MAEAGFDIRPVARAEAAAWRALRLEALKNHPIAFMLSYEEAVKHDLDFFTAGIPEPGGTDILFGVYADGALSGCAGFAREPGAKEKHKGVMWGVYLRPALRGRGIGETMVVRLLEHARDHVALVRCSVTVENASAADLYRRRGFVQYGIEPRSLRYEGRDYDEALLAISFD